MRRPHWFTLGALIFGLWGLLSTSVSIARYGWEQGMYLWYCNAALLATAFGLWRKNRGLLLAFLGVATFTQPLYLFDSVWHLTTGASLFAAAEFMYQPGMTMGEFLLSRYHYFTVPAMILAICHLPRGKDRLLTYIAAFEVGIFGLSYFVFPAAQNLNCIHESCFDALPYSGALYSLSFFALVAAANVAFSLGWNKLLTKLTTLPNWHKPARVIFIALIAAGLVMTSLDVIYKKRIPKLTCAPPFEDSGVKVECLFTLESDPGIVELTYSIENKLDVAQHCNTRGDMFGEFEEFDEGIYLRPKATLKLKALMPYPTKDTELKIAASCLRMQ